MITDLNYSELVIASIQSCSHVALLCLTGYVAASIGILNKLTQKGLSSLIINIFMPCLLFSNIGSDIDLETLIRLWPIPALYVSFALLSGLLGAIGGKLLSLSTSVTKFLMTCIIFNNVTSLSLGLLEGVGNTKAINILRRDEHDSPAEAVERGMSYILLATLLSNLFRWSLGTYLLKKESDEEIDLNSNTEQPLPIFHDNNNDQALGSFVSERTPLIIKSIEKKSVNIGVKILRFVRNVFKSIMEIMNPPLYAAIAALIIGTIPALKGIFFGVNAPLITLTSIAQNLGRISVPLNLLTLGAQIKTLPGSEMNKIFPQLSWMMICRFVIMPAIGITIVINTFGYYIDDPMFWFVLMLMASGPPAVNCINLTHLTGTFQEEMTTLLFYSYAAVAPLMAAAVMIMLICIDKSRPDLAN